MAGVVANFDQLAVWSSGMILALGARGPGLNSQNSPISNLGGWLCSLAIALHRDWLFGLVA